MYCPVCSLSVCLCVQAPSLSGHTFYTISYRMSLEMRRKWPVWPENCDCQNKDAFQNHALPVSMGEIYVREWGRKHYKNISVCLG